jgi:hypothetical protein
MGYTSERFNIILAHPLPDEVEGVSFQQPRNILDAYTLGYVERERPREMLKVGASSCQ